MGPNATIWHFLVRTENNIHLVEVYRNIITWLWCDLKNRGSYTKKSATTHHIPPSPFLEKGFAESFWGVWGFCRHELPISLQGPAIIINLSLFQTPVFWYCLASLPVRHRDLHFGNTACILASNIHITTSDKTSFKNIFDTSFPLRRSVSHSHWPQDRI